ncbi:hypothetical protein HWV62_20009 [Athelia sp. TMB]|nr:hypothetical protein HWV62_20009 [Athelia sp. TMB]
MPPPSPAGLALQAIKNFRLKEIRAPRYKVLTHYRAPIPKAVPSTSKAADAAKDATAAPPAADAADAVKAHGQPNPFLPRFNVKTGRWAPAKYSLRAQAELIKHAKRSGTVALLPPGPKMDELDILTHVSSASPPPSAVRKALWAHKDAVQWEGAPKAKVAGAEIGNRLYAGKRRMFKGHKWERTKAAVEVRRAMLLKDMPKRIVRYKGETPGSAGPREGGEGGEAAVLDYFAAAYVLLMSQAFWLRFYTEHKRGPALRVVLCLRSVSTRGTSIAILISERMNAFLSSKRIKIRLNGVSVAHYAEQIKYIPRHKSEKKATSRRCPSQRQSAPIATPTSPTPIATNADPLPCLLRATAAPVCVGVLDATLLLAVVALFGAVVVDAAEDDDETDVDVGVEELITLDVEVMVGLGKESDGLADATLQNCCESFSAALSSEGQVTEMQATMALGKVLLPLWSGTLISTAKARGLGRNALFAEAVHVHYTGAVRSCDRAFEAVGHYERRG